MTTFNHQYIGRKNWRLREELSIILNCTDINFFEPVGLSFLAGVITNQVEKSESLLIKFSSVVLNYLERIDFLQFIMNRFPESVNIQPERPDIQRKPLKGSLLEFREIEFTDRFHMRKIISDLALITFQKSNGAIPSVFVNDVFGELLDNVRRHSCVNHFFVVAQSYQNTVKISIADLGIGIPEKIKSEFNHVKTDPEAIIYATKEGISTYPEGGWGLTTLRSYLKFSGEYLFIASNNGCVKFIQKRPYIYQNYGCDFSGTFVEICFRTDVIRTPEIEDNWLPF